MADQPALRAWVLEAVRELGGRARPIEVAKHIWTRHADDLRAAGDLFYTWQYDMRWEAQKLRDVGTFTAKHGKRSGAWELNGGRGQDE